MRQVPDWDGYFLAIAHAVATRSKDPRTQVGAVLTRDRDVLSHGYNGFLPGVYEIPERWEAPLKYQRVVHAEVNAVARAARNGIRTEGSTLYVTLAPCLNCGKVVAAAGVIEIVYDADFTAAYPNKAHHEIEEMSLYLEEAGLVVRGASRAGS